MRKLLFPLLLLFTILQFSGTERVGTVDTPQNYLSLPIDTTHQTMRYKNRYTPTVPCLPRGCSHNDYWQEEPLFQALSMGYMYIEADIHLIRGELYVAHKRPWRLNNAHTLEALYLDPLFQIFKQQGFFFADATTPLTLMIDIKTDAENTYQVLMEKIKPYQAMLTHYLEDREIPGAITLMITGQRPIEIMAKEQERWACFDGRPRDLGKGYPVSLMPLVSEKYSTILGWTTTFGPNSVKNISKIQFFINSAKAEDRMTRLWKIPEKEATWDWLTQEGIDLLNTDKLSDLTLYFDKNRKIKDKKTAEEVIAKIKK